MIIVSLLYASYCYFTTSSISMWTQSTVPTQTAGHPTNWWPAYVLYGLLSCITLRLLQLSARCSSASGCVGVAETLGYCTNATVVRNGTTHPYACQKLCPRTARTARTVRTVRSIQNSHTSFLSLLSMQQGVLTAEFSGSSHSHIWTRQTPCLHVLPTAIC